MNSKVEQNSPPRRRRIRLIFVFLGQILLLLTTAELGARTYGRITNQVRGCAFHKDYGFKLIPNIKKVDKIWCDKEPARTNSHGWRDREHSYRKPEGLQRIVALGDSFTFGYGLDYGDRFTELLERDLANVEVINLGVFSYGTDQQLRVFEVEGWRYQPDIVLLSVFTYNDLDEIGYKELFSWPKPYYRIENNQLVLVPPRNNWKIRLRTVSYLAEFYLQRFESSQPQFRQAAEWEAVDRLQLFEKIVSTLAQRVAKSRAKLLVMLIHHRQSLVRGPSKRANRIIQTLNRMGIQTLDTYDAMVAKHNTGVRLYKETDGHWSIAGNKLATQLIAEKLKKLNWANSIPAR